MQVDVPGVERARVHRLRLARRLPDDVLDGRPREGRRERVLHGGRQRGAHVLRKLSSPQDSSLAHAAAPEHQLRVAALYSYSRSALALHSRCC